MLWGKKHYMKSLPDSQMLIEERAPSDAEVQEDADGGNTELSRCPAHPDSAGATELWPEAPSPAGATEGLRAGLASPALLQPLPCTSDGTRSPSYAPFLSAN